jgi:hypothetical protein
MENMKIERYTPYSCKADAPTNPLKRTEGNKNLYKKQNYNKKLFGSWYFNSLYFANQRAVKGFDYAGKIFHACYPGGGQLLILNGKKCANGEARFHRMAT